MHLRVDEILCNNVFPGSVVLIFVFRSYIVTSSYLIVLCHFSHILSDLVFSHLQYLMMYLTGTICSQDSAVEAVSPIPCNLDEVCEEATKRRSLLKAASYDSLQFLVPLQHDPADADSGDEAYSVPLSMRRPRSDSGSRYLTDDVCYSSSVFNLQYFMGFLCKGFRIFREPFWTQFSD